jgi:hypothetical protein
LFLLRLRCRYLFSRWLHRTARWSERFAQRGLRGGLLRCNRLLHCNSLLLRCGLLCGCPRRGLSCMGQRGGLRGRHRGLIRPLRSLLLG